MKRRLFFIVEQLNFLGFAEIVSVSLSNYLNEDFDVFLVASESINRGKVNDFFEVHPRVRIKSLNLQKGDGLFKKYSNKQIEEIDEVLSKASRDNDIVILYNDALVKYLPLSIKKVLISGFGEYHDLSLFDCVIFFSKTDYENNCLKFPNIVNKFVYIEPFAQFSFEEDYKFHGNRILAISYFKAKDNLNRIFTLAEGLKEKGMKFKITLCGEGSKEKEFLDEIITRKLEDYVELFHYDRLHRLFQDSDIFYYFSDEEVYPLYLIEALGSSLPVVSHSTSFYPKDVLGDNGIFVSDSEQAINAIYKLLSDKIKLGKKKFETFYYSEKYSKNNTIKTVIELLNRI